MLFLDFLFSCFIVLADGNNVAGVLQDADSRAQTRSQV